MTGILAPWWFPYGMFAVWVWNTYCFARALINRDLWWAALFKLCGLAAFALMIASIFQQAN